MGINVLFIYPNTFGMNMLPPAIATFSAILKQHNHQVQVFDTTYYAVDYGIDSDGSKEQGLNVIPFSKEMEKKNLRIKNTNWKTDLKKQLDDAESRIKRLLIRFEQFEYDSKDEK